MTRLQSELRRLYFPVSQMPEAADASPSTLFDRSDRVRAMVFELALPASWEVLSKVWKGVQAELGLPAPAVAVSGSDGLQLWFSLAEPISAAQAHAFLEHLRLRYLPDIASSRTRLLPSSQPAAKHLERHAQVVPALQASSENWSAFVAPDLAQIFADTPWLDIPPNEEGQANLLRGLESIQAAAFAAASQKFGPAAAVSSSTATAALNTDLPVSNAPSSVASPRDDPKHFLLRVMNDDTVPLALRIDAAKALLTHADGHPLQPGA